MTVFFCLVATGEFAAAALPVRLVDVMDGTAADAVAASQYVGTQMRRVLLAPPTSAPSVHEVDNEGQIHLLPGEDLPLLEAGSSGLRLLMEYYEGPVSLFSSTRKGFEYVSREVLDKNEVLTLRPPGMPTERARLYARQVFSLEQRLTTREITVPTGGRLDFAIALQQDWRIPRGSGAVFRIRVLQNEEAHTVFEETLLHSVNYEEPRWRSHAVDMGAFAGRQVRVVFETEADAASDDPDARFAFPLWADPVLHSQVAEAGAALPNIVFIALDTLRADRLGCYGYPRPTSHHIDRLAETSVLFEQAIAPAPWTTPTFASLFTGLHPSLHQAGLFRKGFGLDRRFVTLAERVRQTDRLTAAFTEGVAIRAQLGFARGFDLYCDGNTPDRHETGTAERTFRNAAAWLEAFGHLPFFLFVHTYECHDPYTPPAPWDLKFADPDYGGMAGGAPAQAVSEEDRRHVSDRYDGGVAYTDAWTGWFIQQLEKLQLLENTLVVLFSDHGEELWEHDGYGHTSTLFEEVLHVPLIMRFPGQMKPQRIATQVSLTDVFATVLEFVGAAVPDGLDAHSLMPLLDADGADAYRRVRVVSELYNFESAHIDGLGFPMEWLMRSLRYPDAKYVVGTRPDFSVPEGTPVLPATPAESLYDLENDPGEQENRAEKQPEVLLRLKRELLEFLGASEPLQDVSDIAPVEVDNLQDEDIQSLQALGYL